MEDNIKQFFINGGYYCAAYYDSEERGKFAKHDRDVNKIVEAIVTAAEQCLANVNDPHWIKQEREYVFFYSSHHHDI